MATFGKARGAAILTSALLAFCSGAAAQELKQGSSEVVGYVGLNSSSGSGFEVGGGYGYALRSNLLAIGEVGYLAGGGGYASNLPGTGFSSHGFEFNGNVHYLFILKNLPKFTPYALGGIGIDHYSFSYNSNVFGYSASITTAGVNIGGGARWQLGDNWGLRPEWKILVGNHIAESLTGGIYYQFGK
jgi:outer membrane protein with beta-barrel domain